MMNLSAAAAAAANACDEFPYAPPNAAAPPSLFPIMEQESSIHREHQQQQLGLGYNPEPNSLALLPPSDAAHHTTIAAGPHDILQFYPASASHYLAASNPYGHFAGSSSFHQSSSSSSSYYYPPPPQAAPEYYFPTLVSSAEENMASFAATQLGLNLGYRTYFPPRGGYTYGHHPPRCQAEGCKADLSGAKRYHRRHKVCDHHSKAPVVVTAGGMHQRFCQQCSRFHLLDEFDDAKKSCRKRLADHNRRRRKSKPSDADAGDKKRAHANKAAPAKD
ncbi:hypothetical protein ACJX0J_041356, partial [Zea mays]